VICSAKFVVINSLLQANPCKPDNQFPYTALPVSPFLLVPLTRWPSGQWKITRNRVRPKDLTAVFIKIQVTCNHKQGRWAYENCILINMASHPKWLAFLYISLLEEYFYIHADDLQSSKNKCRKTNCGKNYQWCHYSKICMCTHTHTAQAVQPTPTPHNNI
jgi:hypothetical protein